VPLTNQERQIAKLVVQTFLASGQGTPRRPLIRELKAPDAVNSLVSSGLLDQVDNGILFPKTLTFHYCGDAEALHRARHSVEVVLYILKDLFENVDKTDFTRSDIETHALEMNKVVEGVTIDLGLYLVREFGVLMGWSGNQTTLTKFQINENIVTLDVSQAWDKFVLGYPQFFESPPQSPVSASPRDGDGLQDRSDAPNGGWEQLGPLGGGGQSDVFLVRNPARTAEREKYIAAMMEQSEIGFIPDRARRFAEAAWAYARPDMPSELGALKVFKTREAGDETEAQAIERLKGEIHVLKQNRPGLLKLLDSNEDERWIVTEYYPNGTLENSPLRFKGNVSFALTAIRSLVETVAGLHDDRIVHRDIKPANVFFGNDPRLILGDFGIVYLPHLADRLTFTEERVGPRDYMPPWGDLGDRLEKVQPNFDVYMLGKLIWSMIAGRLKLPREWHRRPEYDLAKMFATDPRMHMVNEILDKCIVEEPNNCLPSARDLLKLLDEIPGVIGRGGQPLADGVPRPCRVCGRGFYHSADENSAKRGGTVHHRLERVIGGREEYVSIMRFKPFVCNLCGHAEFFKVEG
jgi:serine/threonine protein kinase